MANPPQPHHIIDISSTTSEVNTPQPSTGSNGSINWNGYPQTEIQSLANCASLNCAQLYAQMKVASIHTCDVQEFEIIRVEEVLQEINLQQLDYYHYCNYLREIHADEYYRQGNAPIIRCAFQDYLNHP